MIYISCLLSGHLDVDSFRYIWKYGVFIRSIENNTPIIVEINQDNMIIYQLTCNQQCINLIGFYFVLISFTIRWSQISNISFIHSFIYRRIWLAKSGRNSRWFSKLNGAGRDVFRRRNDGQSGSL